MTPSGELAARVHRAAGSRCVGWQRVIGRGYSSSERWLVDLADGRTVFVKTSDDPMLARWLRKEHAVYCALGPNPFLADHVGWDDDGRQPVLVLEDLSAGDWEPAWTAQRIEAVLGVLHEVAGSPTPSDAGPVEANRARWAPWRAVADDPQPFLGLGLCSPAWLERTLGDLLAAADKAVLEGDALLHVDVRSDNLCFVGSRTVLVDWNWAAVGNPVLDVAAWLPSLQCEGGPPPEDILPGQGELAALLAGIWGGAAGLPPPPTAPSVRRVQLAQLRSALPWAVRELGLRPLDGPSLA